MSQHPLNSQYHSLHKLRNLKISSAFFSQNFLISRQHLFCFDQNFVPVLDLANGIIIYTSDDVIAIV